MKNYLKTLLVLLFMGVFAGCENTKNSDSSENKIAIKNWDECTLASCWNGKNASNRMMNMLSPKMSDEKFVSYMNWMKSRGCNTSHLILANKNDGEKGGYTIYGENFDWSIDQNTVNLMKSRINTLRKNGFGIVLWLFTDDSSAYTSEAKKNFPKYLKDLKDSGLLDYASTIVVGLELQEYYNAQNVAALVSATRAVYSGKVGTHETSGNYSFARLSDICFYQVSPGKSASWIKSEAARIKKATGKPVNFFEMERGPDRNKSQAALDGGAFGVGNW